MKSEILLNTESPWCHYRISSQKKNLFTAFRQKKDPFLVFTQIIFLCPYTIWVDIFWFPSIWYYSIVFNNDGPQNDVSFYRPCCFILFLEEFDLGSFGVKVHGTHILLSKAFTMQFFSVCKGL